MDHKAKRYYIQEHLQKTVFHGGVGNIDIERILLNLGFEPIIFPYHDAFTVKAKWFRYVYLLKTVFLLPAGATVFFQFPLYARMHKLLVRLLGLRSSVRVICLLADINGLKDGDDEVMKAELLMLKKLKFFIVHGTAMDNWLKQHVPHAVTSFLYFFDFLASPSTRPRSKEGVIVFAGNLAKSPFIEKLQHALGEHHELRFNLYGPEVTGQMMSQPGLEYKGVVDPYQLPAVVEGAFGLIWDGTSAEGAGGSIGDYMQYISHHKLSLYILSGLPLIVFHQAGSASMIRELNIGITISSISEIPEKLKQLTEDDYQAMRNNLKPLAEKIAAGENLKAAVRVFFNDAPVKDER